MRVGAITERDLDWMRSLLSERWASAEVVTRGRLHRADRLPGLVALEGERPVGLVTYSIEGRDCEIVTLDSLEPGKGTGSALVQAVAHLLKYCCLCDGAPFPHEKWLYQVGVATSLGKRIKGYVGDILTEVRRDHVVYEVPDAYVAPGHRNEAFEHYRLYHLFELLWEQADAFHRERFPGEIK